MMSHSHAPRYPYGSVDPRSSRSLYGFASFDASLLDAHRRSRSRLAANEHAGEPADHTSCGDTCTPKLLERESIESEVLERLRRKLEVFRRLAHRYGPDGRRIGDDDCDADAYALVADHLMGHATTSDELASLRWLNAGMKALDVATFLSSELTPLTTDRLRRAIALERRLLDDLGSRAAALP